MSSRAPCRSLREVVIGLGIQVSLRTADSSTLSCTASPAAPQRRKPGRPLGQGGSHEGRDAEARPGDSASPSLGACCQPGDRGHHHKGERWLATHARAKHWVSVAQDPLKETWHHLRVLMRGSQDSSAPPPAPRPLPSGLLGAQSPAPDRPEPSFARFGPSALWNQSRAGSKPPCPLPFQQPSRCFPST